MATEIVFETGRCTPCKGTGIRTGMVYQGYGRDYARERWTCAICEGTGRSMTTKGRAAEVAMNEWLVEHMTRTADQLTPGMLVLNRTTYVTEGRTRRYVRTWTAVEDINTAAIASAYGHRGFVVWPTGADLDALAAHMAGIPGVTIRQPA